MSRAPRSVGRAAPERAARAVLGAVALTTALCAVGLLVEHGAVAPRAQAGDPGAPDCERAPVSPQVATGAKADSVLLHRVAVADPAGRTGADAAATATLCGRVTSAGRVPVRAQVELTGGPNRGERAVCDDAGRFSIGGLSPGLALVAVRAAGVGRCVRQVQLRQRGRDRLDLDFGAYGTIRGRVTDRDGAPVPDATVELDGDLSWTGPDGTFAVCRGVSGTPLLVVRKPGFCAFRVRSNCLRDRDAGPIDIRLERSAGLAVLVRAPRRSVAASAPSSVAVYARPVSTGPRTPDVPDSYPWRLLAPARVVPGGVARFCDLPPGPVCVVVVGESAPAASARAWLPSGRAARLEVEVPAALPRATDDALTRTLRALRAASPRAPLGLIEIRPAARGERGQPGTSPELAPRSVDGRARRRRCSS